MHFGVVAPIILRRKAGKYMQYQLIATDLDGTLLDESGRLSPENLKALEILTRMGVTVVPASGRALEEMPKEIRECPFFRYYITSNGASIYDKETGLLKEWALSPALGAEVLDQLESYDTVSFIHIGPRTYAEESTHSPKQYAKYNMNPTWQDYAMNYLFPIPHMLPFAREQGNIQSLTVFFKHIEDFEAVWSVWEKDSRLGLAQTDPYNIEVFLSQAGKGTALGYLADFLGIDRKATIALGDSTNDLSMLQAAGLGLAMENAAPKAKELADAVICHHRDHCLKYVLEHCCR